MCSETVFSRKPVSEMGWRSVVISSPAVLKRRHNSLAIIQGNTALIPFEDIAVIILNHREITLTHPVLSFCSQHGIALFATGDDHQPCGVFVPFLTHTRTTKLLRQQLSAPKPLTKRTWAAIVQSKIHNQSTCLRLSGKRGASQLESYRRRVRSGDSTNMEGQAAWAYFTQLFGDKFRRGADDWRNSALNYGYAVLRGAIARSLVGHGFHPSVGLFHSSERNAFNLADDIIEPFRPVVDLSVVKRYGNSDKIALTTEDKAYLISLLNVDVSLSNDKTSVLSAIDDVVTSIMRVFEQQDEALLVLPILLGMNQHVDND